MRSGGRSLESTVRGPWDITRSWSNVMSNLRRGLHSLSGGDRETFYLCTSHIAFFRFGLRSDIDVGTPNTMLSSVFVILFIPALVFCSNFLYNGRIYVKNDDYLPRGSYLSFGDDMQAHLGIDLTRFIPLLTLFCAYSFLARPELDNPDVKLSLPFLQLDSKNRCYNVPRQFNVELANYDFYPSVHYVRHDSLQADGQGGTYSSTYQGVIRLEGIGNAGTREPPIPDPNQDYLYFSLNCDSHIITPTYCHAGETECRSVVLYLRSGNAEVRAKQHNCHASLRSNS